MTGPLTLNVLPPNSSFSLALTRSTIVRSLSLSALAGHSCVIGLGEKIFARLNSGEILRDLSGWIGLRLYELNFAAVTQETMRIGWTEDVFDRMIAAQAMVRKPKLITADSVILEGDEKAVW